MRSGNSWMSVAPFRDLEAERAAGRPGRGAATSSSSPRGLPARVAPPNPPAGVHRPGSLDLAVAGLGVGAQRPATPAGSGGPPAGLRRGVCFLGCFRLAASRPPRPPASTRTPRTGTGPGTKAAADPRGRRGARKRGPLQGQGPGSTPGQDPGARGPSIKCAETPRVQGEDGTRRRARRPGVRWEAVGAGGAAGPEPPGKGVERGRGLGISRVEEEARQPVARPTAQAAGQTGTRRNRCRSRTGGQVDALGREQAPPWTGPAHSPPQGLGGR